MGRGRIYTDMVTIGDIDIFQVTADPNGVLPARNGSMAVQNTEAEPRVWQNVGGLMVWVLTGNVVNTDDVQLAADLTTTSTPPVYVPMLSLPFVKILGTSLLDIRFKTSVFHSGVGGVNVAANFRVTIGGVLQVGGCTANQLTSRIMSTGLEMRKPAAAGAVTVEVEWAKFGPLTQTLACLVASIPDLFNASLVVEEHRS